MRQRSACLRWKTDYPPSWKKKEKKYGKWVFKTLTHSVSEGQCPWDGIKKGESASASVLLPWECFQTVTPREGTQLEPSRFPELGWWNWEWVEFSGSSGRGERATQESMAGICRRPLFEYSAEYWLAQANLE